MTPARTSPPAEADPRPADAPRRRGPGTGALRWAAWSPVPAAAAFAVLLGISFTRLGDALAWNADYVSPLLVAETIASDAGLSDTVLGTFGPYTTILIDVLTADLPGHRRLWLTWPCLVALAGVALMARCSWRLGGRWAAAVTAAVGVSVSTPLLAVYVAPANRNALLFCQALLGAVLLALGSGRLRRWRAVVAALGVGVIVGASIGSDALVAVAGLVPFAGAALIVALATRGPAARRVLAVAGATTGSALAAWGVTAAVSRELGFRTLGATRETIPLATPGEAADNLERLVRNIMSFANGDVIGDPVTAIWFPGALAGVLALIAAAVPVGLAWGGLRRLFRARREPGAAAPQQDEAETGRALYLVYWGLTVAVSVAAFVGTNLAVIADVGTARYLVAVFFAIAATLPLWAGARPRPRALVGTGVALACALSAFALSEQRIARGHEALPWAQISDEVYALAAGRGVRRAYASYGESSPLSWASGGALEVRPVLGCTGPDGRDTLCPFVANVMADWYAPDPGPSMVIVTPLVGFALPPEPAPALGAPESVHRFGPSTVYVYPEDVRRRFGNVGFPPAG